MLNIAHYIANLPYSVSAFAKITNCNLLIIVFGMLWFCLWKTRIRMIGIATILLGIILQSLVVKPDVFVDWDSKQVAVLDKNNRLIFLTKQLAKFKKQLLMNQLGTKIALRYPQGKSDYLFCQDKQCILEKDQHKVDINLETMEFKIIENGELKKTIRKDKGTEFIYIGL